MLTCIPALRLVFWRYFGTPFPTNDQAFALVPVPFELFNFIKEFDSSNQVMFERRGLCRARNIECQHKSKHCENYLIHSRKLNFLKLILDYSILGIISFRICEIGVRGICQTKVSSCQICILKVSISELRAC
jgi:hypothetical protein